MFSSSSPSLVSTSSEIQFLKLQNELFKESKIHSDQIINQLKQELLEKHELLNEAAKHATNNLSTIQQQSSVIKQLESSLETLKAENQQLLMTISSLSKSSQYHKQAVIGSESLQYQGVLMFVSSYTPKNSCEQEILQIGMINKKESFQFALKECQQWMKSFKTNPNHNPQSLTDDEMMAIVSYTFDLGFNGSREDNIFFELNLVLQTRSNNNMACWKGYLYYLLSALKKIPNETVVVYRGMPFNNKFTENYSNGRRIHWSGFSSTTSNINVAAGFAASEGKIGALMMITAKNAKCIKQYSYVPREEEYLLSPNSAFVVVKEFSIATEDQLQKLFGTKWSNYIGLYIAKLVETDGDTFVW